MAGFTKVDNDLILNNELGVYEKLLYIYFLSIGDNIYPSYKQICRILKCSKPKAIKTVQALIDKKYIKVTQSKTKGDFDNNTYTLIHDLEVVNEIDNVVNEIDNGCKQDLLQVVNDVYPNNTNKTILNKKDIYIDLKFIDDSIDKVKITQEQFEKLTSHFGKELIYKNILSLDNYISNGKGNKYKNHYKVLNTWCNKNKEQLKPAGENQKSIYANFKEIE